MTDRRAADRRQALHLPAVDRRHGERRTYQAGCRCFDCHTANAAYSKAYYRDRALGKRRLGALVRAVVVFRQLRTLRAEDFTLADLAARLGLHWQTLRPHTQFVTRRTAVLVGRLHREHADYDAETGTLHPGIPDRSECHAGGQARRLSPEDGGEAGSTK